MLADAKPAHEGIGGKSAFISINNAPIFVKKVPLTDLERLPQNFMSTANPCNLLLGYMDLNRVFEIFTQYCTNDNKSMSKEDFLKNLEVKKGHPDFNSNTRTLLLIEYQRNSQ